MVCDFRSSFELFFIMAYSHDCGLTVDRTPWAKQKLS
jgi:hypothetical protein